MNLPADIIRAKDKFDPEDKWISDQVQELHQSMFNSSCTWDKIGLSLKFHWALVLELENILAHHGGLRSMQIPPPFYFQKHVKINLEPPDLENTG